MTDKEIQIIVEDINFVRKECINNWYNYIDKVHGIKIKGYNTWIQKIERGDFTDSSPMSMTVKEFKEWLTNWIKGTDSYATT